VSTDICLKLFQNEVFNLSVTPDRISSIRQNIYPRLYPRVQSTNCICFTPQPVPADAIVKNANDLQKILEDPRFVIKSVVFRGKIEDLQEVRDSLSENLKDNFIDYNNNEEEEEYLALESAEEVEYSPDYSDNEPEPSEKEEEPIIIDEENRLYNSFIGINKLPLGKVTVEDYLAEGAFGKVYRGKWVEKQVALKQINMQHALKKLEGIYLYNSDIEEAMQWEVSRLSTANHPNLVQFYGLYQDENEGYTYLVMEFCEGGTLKGALKREYVPWSKRWQWALQITGALAYLHSEGILHRDLKAENILLDCYGKAKLADLGVAQVDALLQENEAKVVREGLQDKRFIAPELENNQTFSTKATDIYALGLVFWEIASGQEPRKIEDLCTYRKEEWRGGKEREPIPRDCPESFKRLILACWEADPTKRPSAQELLVKLEVLEAEFDSYHHALIKACEKLERVIHARRKEGLSYIAPFVTEHRLEESIESYWSRIEASKAKEERAGNPPLELWDTFKKFIENAGSATLLLLGEAGLGKTLTTYLWADQLLSQWWTHINKGEKAPKYFPLFIRPFLSRWSHESIKGAFLEVARQYNLPKKISPLVFVDGYDELASSEKDERAPNLIKHLRLEGMIDAKLIVTCRPNTVDANELEHRFSFNGKLETRHFLPFSMDQLLTYLKMELSWDDELHNEYKETLEDAESVRTVLRNPFVLHLLKKSWKVLIEGSQENPLRNLSRWQIYEGFVKYAITTQSSLLSTELQVSLANGYSNLVESFQAFAKDIAFKACQKRGIAFSLQEALRELNHAWVKLKKLVKEDARKQFAKRQEELNKASDKEKVQKERRVLLSEEDFVVMMQSRRYQFENDLPLKIRSNRYEFSHKSIFEYFVAKRLLDFQESETDFISEEELQLLVKDLVKSSPEALLFLHEAWSQVKDHELTIFSSLEILNKEVSSNKVLANIAILLSAIGEVLGKKAHYEEALENHKQALAIRKRVYGKEHPDVAQSYHNIGVIFRFQAKYEQAMEHLYKSLAIRKQLYGKGHSDIAESYHHIGGVLFFQGKYEKALEYYKPALAIFEKVYGKQHSNVSDSYNDVGSVLLVQGNYTEALEYFSKAFVICEQVYEKDNPKIAIAYNSMGQALRAKGNYAQALEYYQKALAIREKVYREEHPEVANSYLSIGQVLQAKGNYAQALEYYQKALTIREKVYREEHPEVASSYSNMGNVLQAKGSYVQALEYYQKALAIYEKVCGKEHPDVAISYNNMGCLLENQGKSKEALECFLKALAIYEKMFGHNHPFTKDCMMNVNRLEKEVAIYNLYNNLYSPLSFLNLLKK